MFFDETYSQHYYRKDTVVNFNDEADCLIVVGTALATNMARNLVYKVLDKECPVIEVNLETAIDKGFNVQVLGKADETLPRLFNEYYKLSKQEVKGNTIDVAPF